MKKSFITFILFTLFIYVSAQVTLERKYNYSTAVVKLETFGYKYFLMDVPNSQCRIYNLDHSLLKTINCSVPSGYFLADIKYISENLFDSDPGLELVYTYYKYYSAQQYYEYDTKIINEDGSTLVTIDGARYNYVNRTGDNTWRLFSYCFDYSVFPEIVWTNIYSLPGEPTVSLRMEEINQDEWINVFPNPATNSVKVEYKLPDNANQGILNLLDNGGNLVKQFVVDNHTDHLLVNVDQYQSGVYHYFIEYNNTRTPSKKLVVK